MTRTNAEGVGRRRQSSGVVVPSRASSARRRGRARAQSSALHYEVHEVLVVDVPLGVLLALQQLLHLGQGVTRSRVASTLTHYLNLRNKDKDVCLFKKKLQAVTECTVTTTLRPVGQSLFVQAGQMMSSHFMNTNGIIQSIIHYLVVS